MSDEEMPAASPDDAQVTEHTVGLEVIRHPTTGRSYLAVDSLVDLFESLIGTVGVTPAESFLQTFVDSVRPLSTYGALDELMAQPRSKVPARVCECGVTIVESKRLTGAAVTVDAEPVPDGQLVPLDGIDGSFSIAPWSPTMAPGVRLREHVCKLR